MDSLKDFDINKMSMQEIESHVERLKEVRNNGKPKQKLVAAMEICEIRQVMKENITKIYKEE